MTRRLVAAGAATVAATVAVAATAVIATPVATADANGNFLEMLSNAGIGYGSSTDATGLGQSVCSTLVEPGKSFAAAVSRVQNNGVSPDMAALFAGIAIQAYCPSMMSSIADGTVLDKLGGLQGLTGSSLLPGLGGLQNLGR
jgi:hypothetical protein